MRGEEHHCESMRRDIAAFIDRLLALHVLEGNPPGRYNWVTKCSVCELHRGGSCRGARVEIPRSAPLRFAPCRLKDGNLVQAEIAIMSRRRGGGRLDLDEHSILVRLWEVPTAAPRNLVNRVHIDLANHGQPGPWSHLQFGGESVEEYENWPLPPIAGHPRWPTALMDLILASELIVYSFWPDKWRLLCEKREIITLIKRAEDAYLRPFFEAWSSCQGLDGNRRTFLSMVCNLTTDHPWRKI
jgi:hypothetical protein